MDDLRKQAAEKAEIEWKEKKERIEKQQIEERDLEEKRRKLEEMRREQELAANRERALMQEEADKIRKHEESLLVSWTVSLTDTTIAWSSTVELNDNGRVIQLLAPFTIILFIVLFF